MGIRQVRISQLIAPFGPGSLYTDRRGIPLIVCGLDHWYKVRDSASGKYVPCDDQPKFEHIEPRLAELLKVDRFAIPPDFRRKSEGSGASTPPNAGITVPALRFPRWYRNTKSGRLRRFGLSTRKLENPEGGGRWQPVRFIAVCESGHLCDFPWKDWIGCTCSSDDKLELQDFGGSELTSINVSCGDCGKRAHLGGVTRLPSNKPEASTVSSENPENQASRAESTAFQRKGIKCPGDRPWLGENAQECGCNAPLVGALINQTNLYFPKTISAISLPQVAHVDPEVIKLRNIIESEAGTLLLGVQLAVWRMGQKDKAARSVCAELQALDVAADVALVRTVLEELFDKSVRITPDQPLPVEPESEFVAFRRNEFNVIREPLNEPDESPHLRVVPTEVPNTLTPYFQRVNLVERLRETRAFYGFTRLKPQASPLTGMPTSAMQQLFKAVPSTPYENWLPAVTVHGEGIYMELNEQRLSEWQQQNADWLLSRLPDDFINRLTDVKLALPPLSPNPRIWASRYLLVHSLAHILINQLVYECGYSTASLRERLFVSADPAAPMAGILIYTAAGDSEGTLGGLVRLGRPEALEPLVIRALSRASWCSADPICAETVGATGSRLANLAACHACTMLPETSCETINEGLDRAMVVGLPESRERGLMADLLATVKAVSY